MLSERGTPVEAKKKESNLKTWNNSSTIRVIKSGLACFSHAYFVPAVSAALLL